MPGRNGVCQISAHEFSNKSKSIKDPLTEIPDEDLPALRDLFKANWPKTIFVYYFIENYMNWKKKRPSMDIIFYCLDGEWRDGTFIAFLTDNNYAVVYSLRPETRNWKNLASSQMLPWDNGLMLGALHSSLQPPVLNAIEMVCNKRPIKEIPCLYHWLPKERALEFETRCPDGYHFGDLFVHQAPFINSKWPHAFPDSVKFISDQIEFNGGLGLYENETNSLVCWILHNNYGAVGILNTLESHRRKGLAEIVTKSFCRKLAERGRDIFSATVVGNVSVNLFKKLGFQTVGLKTWYQF